MSKTRTTAGELIAMLSELDPNTHVFVDIGNHDWEHSEAITLRPVESDDWLHNDKPGAVHLAGLDKWEAEYQNTIEGEML